MKELKFNSPKRTSEILASSFWWNRIIHTWDVGFSKSKAVKFHGLGWVSMSNVWVVFVGRFASKEKMGENFVLSLESLPSWKRCGGGGGGVAGGGREVVGEKKREYFLGR